MLQGFIRFSEFAEFTEFVIHLGKTPIKADWVQWRTKCEVCETRSIPNDQ